MWIRFWAHSSRTPYRNRTEMYFWRDEEPNKVLLKDELDEWARDKMQGCEHYHYGKEILRKKKLPDTVRAMMIAGREYAVKENQRILEILRSGR